MNRNEVAHGGVLMKGVENMDFLLFLQKGMERKAHYLKNMFYPPYRKPLLPFGENDATVHHLLQSLKIAHTMMVEKLVPLKDNPVDGWYVTNLYYNIDKLFPFESEQYQNGQKHYDQKMQIPFLVEGFELANFDPSDSEFLCVSFDLTPFYSEYPDYPGYSAVGKLKPAFDSLKLAAGFYNEAVTQLFNEGYFIIPGSHMITVMTDLPSRDDHLLSI